MFVAVLICLFCCLYYLYFRRKRKQLYEFSKSIPSVGNLPVVGHSHWFIGGPESKIFLYLITTTNTSTTSFTLSL